MTKCTKTQTNLLLVLCRENLKTPVRDDKTHKEGFTCRTWVIMSHQATKHNKLHRTDVVFPFWIGLEDKLGSLFDLWLWTNQRIDKDKKKPRLSLDHHSSILNLT